MLFETEKIEDCRQGKLQTVSNIEVCEKIARFLSKTLGPYGLDKLFYGQTLLITNDGATIMENMSFSHPIGQLLANLSKAQDHEVGDGTTSVILLTSAILGQFKEFILKDYTVEEIRGVLNKCMTDCLSKLNRIKIKFDEDKLIKLACTCLNSKNIRNNKEKYAKKLVEILAQETEKELFISTIPEGSLQEPVILNGVVFEKTFTYAGYEQQPRKLENAKIVCIDIELEWKNEKENALLKIDSVESYQKIVDTEYLLLKEKMDDLIEFGAKIVLSSKSIGDLATQYFAAHGIFSAGRVGKELEKITAAFGGRINTTTKHLSCGHVELFEERQLGASRYNYFISSKSKVKTLLLRGPGRQVVDEVERAVHDAVCVLKKVIFTKEIVTGGGSVEMIMSNVCRKNFKDAGAREKFLFKAIGMAFEKIPLLLAQNFGLDPMIHIQKLRSAHFENKESYGISAYGPEDMNKLGIYEPLSVKTNMIKAAFATVDTILSIKGTLVNTHAENQ